MQRLIFSQKSFMEIGITLLNQIMNAEVIS